MKKILKNIAIVLVFFALSSFFSGCQNGDKAYNDAIKTRFEQVEEKLDERLYENTNYVNWTNREITHVRFLETKEEIANIQVYYKGTLSNEYLTSDRKAYAKFNILTKYYDDLIKAKESGNVLHYLDAFDIIFTKMSFVENVQKSYIVECRLRDSREAADFNEIFNINDVGNEDVVRQVGFLPYHIEVVDYHYNEETSVADYSYKIYGISYCETKSENRDEIKQHEDLILESSYNKNNVKAFNREMLYTSSCHNEGGVTIYDRLSGDIWMIIDGVNNSYTIETTHFSEINLLKIYEDIKDGEFYYKKPSGFNVKEYLENI